MSSILLDYFAKNGAPCLPDVNAAEHIIDSVSGSGGSGVDWHDIWLNSAEKKTVDAELRRIKSNCLDKESTIKDDARDFATPLWIQLRLVTHRQQIALWRNPDCVWNKIFLHIFSALFSGFTFWMIGDGLNDLQPAFSPFSTSCSSLWVQSTNFSPCSCKVEISSRLEKRRFFYPQSFLLTVNRC
jgi:hypothetical protein